MVGSSREIWCSNRETGSWRLPGKPGELAGMRDGANE